ncbi:hypothetical protein [Flavobacterium sp. I3-2]|uniref:hypothetical protein n=1 Tax=Flavobacterium sp. I3-2 TaxID=2748319 RepID=UPI0015AE033F|nr:hypothetical protein [Flavobacterium sp. I3-2]
MRYLYFLIFITLFGCSKKEVKPDLDYVRIEMFPAMQFSPATLEIDLIKKTFIFSGLQQISSIDAECNDYYEKTEKPLDFVYIDLNEEEINKIETVLNNKFFNDVKQINELVIKNKTIEQFDGIYFEFDILKNNQTYSTEDLLILNESEEKKVFELLKILKEHQNSEVNNKYIEKISFYLE